MAAGCPGPSTTFRSNNESQVIGARSWVRARGTLNDELNGSNNCAQRRHKTFNVTMKKQQARQTSRNKPQFQPLKANPATTSKQVPCEASSISSDGAIELI